MILKVSCKYNLTLFHQDQEKPAWMWMLFFLLSSCKLFCLAKKKKGDLFPYKFFKTTDETHKNLLPLFHEFSRDCNLSYCHGSSSHSSCICWWNMDNCVRVFFHFMNAMCWPIFRLWCMEKRPTVKYKEKGQRHGVKKSVQCYYWIRETKLVSYLTKIHN